MSKVETKHNVVVIGSGFGGTMTALSLGRVFKQRGKGETVHILERGTWWTTPVGTVQDLDIRTPKHLRDNGQPVQYSTEVNVTPAISIHVAQRHPGPVFQDPILGGGQVG